MTQWYFARGGQQNGPVSLDELRALAQSGGLEPRDLVWNPSMADWLPASSVTGIFGGGVMEGMDPGNPYAPPGSAWGVTAVSYEGSPLTEIQPGSEPLDVMACIGRGFKLTTRNFLLVLLAGLVVVGIWLLFIGPFIGLEAKDQYEEAMRHIAARTRVVTDYKRTFTPLYLAQQAMNLVVMSFLTLGITRIALNLVSGEKASVSQLFSQGGKLLRMIGGSVLLGLPFWLAAGLLAFLGSVAIAWIGYAFFILVGVYFLIRYGQFSSALVDRDMKLFEAMQYSSILTEGNRWAIFGLGIMGFLIAIVGALVCCVGLLFAMPVIYISAAVAYRWLQYGRRAVLDYPGTDVPLVKRKEALEEINPRSSEL